MVIKLRTLYFMSSLSVKTNRLFSPATPPPHLSTPPPLQNIQGLMDCDVYRPHAELGKIPSAVSFKTREARCYSSTFLFFFKEIYNSLTVHVEERALVCIGARSLQDGAKLEHVSTPRSECYRACLKFTAKVFQA